MFYVILHAVLLSVLIWVQSPGLVDSRTWRLQCRGEEKWKRPLEKCDQLASFKSNFSLFFIGFLTIIYKTPYKKQEFLIQFANLDRFPGSTQKFSKTLFGHFRPFFGIISFF